MTPGTKVQHPDYRSLTFVYTGRVGTQFRLTNISGGHIESIDIDSLEDVAVVVVSKADGSKRWGA